mmetsp:Transcript_34095/g.74558  ORF Transcript_34095/g.74558 Transcript_34095/m.74558 type:complete len:247 (+) Transcript_34095:880-1620(+)
MAVASQVRVRRLVGPALLAEPPAALAARHHQGQDLLAGALRWVREVGGQLTALARAAPGAHYKPRRGRVAGGGGGADVGPGLGGGGQLELLHGGGVHDAHHPPHPPREVLLRELRGVRRLRGHLQGRRCGAAELEVGGAHARRDGHGQAAGDLWGERAEGVAEGVLGNVARALGPSLHVGGGRAPARAVLFVPRPRTLHQVELGRLLLLQRVAQELPLVLPPHWPSIFLSGSKPDRQVEVSAGCGW